MKKKKKFKILRFFVIMVFISVIGYFSIYLFAKTTPKLSINSANSLYLYDKNNNLYSGNEDDWISLNNISKHLINATISVEDKNFYKHDGFDYLRILKALYTNIISGKTVQGASTITQQYAKNLYLTFDKTWNRKFEEAWLTIRLESQYDKDQILEGYLNTINYGGVFGIENASFYYFNKSASELNLSEASILAGIPKLPSLYSPLVNFEKSKERQLLILNSMVKNGYITEEEKNKAYNEELKFYGVSKKSELTTLMYYQDAVIDELKTIDSIPSSFIKTGGLKIYTNLDMELQKNLEESMNNNFDENSDIEVASAAIIPDTGEVVALIGGRNYSKSQYNRATEAKRQVGSTMKPFLYYAALENGFTASSTFTSSKTTFVFSNDKTYSPNNYANLYPDKPISMAAAIAYSDNIYAVKTNLFLGEDTLVDISKRIGITSKLEAVPSLALGTNEINLLEMTSAYSTFANEGYKIKPHLINKVEDMNGNVLYEFKETKENVLNKSLVFIINELLSNTYSSDFVDYNYPTCFNIASKINNKYAIKTGTTDTDHLIFGYNKDLIIGIWSGFDDNAITSVDDGATIKNMWVESMEKYFLEKEANWYDMPNNVVGVLVNPISGEIVFDESEKKTLLYYIKGTEPYADTSALDNLIPTMKEE